MKDDFFAEGLKVIFVGLSFIFIVYLIIQSLVVAIKGMGIL